ncbi:MAG: GerMN domain-containing protein [Elainella sp.]
MRDSDPATPSTSRSRIPRSVLAGLSAVVLAAGAGTAWWTWKSAQPTSPDTISAPSASPSPTDITQAPIAQTIQVYWLKSIDTRFEIVPSPVNVSAPGQPEALLKAALEAMLKGSDSPDLTSTVPQGTTLRQVTIQPDGVHVDLSQAFTSGGGSASMTGRVGQVIYTATTLDPQAPVWLSVEGKPLEVLGGEGLMIDQPMTREMFDQNFMAQ